MAFKPHPFNQVSQSYPHYFLDPECLGMLFKPLTGSLNLLNYHSWWEDHLHIGGYKGNQNDTHMRELPSQ